MPRLHNVRERRHQPFWDTLIRATGAPGAVTSNIPRGPLAQSSRLFGNANVGNLQLTNLQVAGQLASDQTFVTLALRSKLYFSGTGAEQLYKDVATQLFFTYSLGDKTQFQAPCWYYPAGGGIFGDSGAAGAEVLSNGWPSQSAILKLAKPIVIPVRQNISVTAEFFPTGPTNVLDAVNGAAEDTQQLVQFFIDGLQTRDVQ